MEKYPTAVSLYVWTILTSVPAFGPYLGKGTELDRPLVWSDMVILKYFSINQKLSEKNTNSQSYLLPLEWQHTACCWILPFSAHTYRFRYCTGIKKPSNLTAFTTLWGCVPLQREQCCAPGGTATSLLLSLPADRLDRSPGLAACREAPGEPIFRAGRGVGNHISECPGFRCKSHFSPSQ